MKMPQYVSVTEVTDTVDFANLLTFKDKLILQTKIEDMEQPQLPQLYAFILHANSHEYASYKILLAELVWL